MNIVELELFAPNSMAPYTEHDDNLRHVQVRRDGVEVARVLLDEVVHIDYYVDTPPLGATALQIELIEVSGKHRLQGIGREVVRRLAQLHPDRRLVAFSEGANEFWQSLGWQRHECRTDPESSQPLFIHPESLGSQVPIAVFRSIKKLHSP